MQKGTSALTQFRHQHTIEALSLLLQLTKPLYMSANLTTPFLHVGVYECLQNMSCNDESILL